MKIQRSTQPREFGGNFFIDFSGSLRCRQTSGFDDENLFCTVPHRAYTYVVVDDTNIPPKKPQKSPVSPDDFFGVDTAGGAPKSDSEIETVILKSEPTDPRPQSAIDTLIKGSDDPNATVVDKATIIENVSRDFLQPVEHLIGEHATRVERIRALLRDLDSNYLRVLLVLEGLSLISVAGIVGFIDVPDGFMYVIMEFLIGLSLLRYIRTSVEDAGAKRWVVGTLVVVLSVLWAGLLFNKVPPEPQWYAVEGGIREELPLLWGPIAGHLAVAIGLILHLPLRRYLRARR